jgi:hypothetical protein
VLLAWLLVGCQETIDLELRPNSPIVVIDAILNDLDNPTCVVRLSYTSDYFKPLESRPILNARVWVEASDGTVDTLRVVPESLGWYASSPALKGVVGQTYQLFVEVDGKLYTAVGTMPRAMPILGTGYVYREQVGFLNAGYYITIAAQENEGLGDYAMSKFYVNGLLKTDPTYIWTLSDEFFDGRFVVTEFVGNSFEANDTVVVELNLIDRTTYEFYQAYSQLVQGSGGPLSSPPWNPRTNIRGGALGLFQVSSTTRDTVIILP